MFGPRPGFVKFIANVVNENGERVPGIVFMRGAAVGMYVSIIVPLILYYPPSNIHHLLLATFHLLLFNL